MIIRMILIVAGCVALSACNTTNGGSIGDKAKTQLDSNFPRGI